MDGPVLISGLWRFLLHFSDSSGLRIKPRVFAIPQAPSLNEFCGVYSPSGGYRIPLTQVSRLRALELEANQPWHSIHSGEA